MMMRKEREKRKEKMKGMKKITMTIMKVIMRTKATVAKAKAKTNRQSEL